MAKDSGCLRFLYNTFVGRILLKGLSAPLLSKWCGAFLDSRASKFLIPSFVKKNGIDLSDYVNTDFKCFNDCFTRQIKPSLRPVCRESDVLISPCDGLLSAYHIQGETVIPVKQSRYSIARLLGSKKEAARFQNGVCLVFRLCVNHYHRYCYVDDAIMLSHCYLQGKLHTVRPIALEKLPVFTENSREVTVMKTTHFGRVAQIEVGAMLVGKIQNHPMRGEVLRGSEKGMFLYGGSTVVLLLQEGSAKISEEYFRATREGREIPVKMGEKIGEK